MLGQNERQKNTTGKVVKITSAFAAAAIGLLAATKWVYDEEYAAPLAWAANNGHTEVVAGLIACGVDVHFRYDLALRAAAYGGQTTTVKYLLKNGATASAADSEALKGASGQGHFEIVKILLDNGADIHAENDFALRQSQYNGHTAIVKLLLDRGADASVLTPSVGNKVNQHNVIQ